MSCVLLWVSFGPKESTNSLVGLAYRSSTSVRTQRRFKLWSQIRFTTGVPSAFSSAAVAAVPSRSSEEKVYEVVLKQAALVRERGRGARIAHDLDNRPIEGDFTNEDLLNAAYDRCGEVCAEYAKTFYLGTCSLVYWSFLIHSLSSFK